MQSHQYLLQNLYDVDYYQFIESLGNKYNISSQDLICLSSRELFKTRITKTSTGYNRALNNILAAHFAYLQRYYNPLNPIILQKLTNSFSIPILKGTRDGFTKTELLNIF